MKRDWIHLKNPFLIATNESYALAVLMSAFHLAALRGASADTFFDDLAEAYQIIHDALNDTYDEWKSKGEVQQGDTLNLSDLLKLLRGTKIKKWDIAIQTIYSNETAQYKALLPNKRKPFQQGKQLARINQVRTLAISPVVCVLFTNHSQHTPSMVGEIKLQPYAIRSLYQRLNPLDIYPAGLNGLNG